MDYINEALDSDDITIGDATVIAVFKTKKFRDLVQKAVNDVSNGGKWSKDDDRNYQLVTESISRYMIKDGFEPLIDLLKEEDTMYLTHTLRAFLKINVDWQNDPFVRRR